MVHSIKRCCHIQHCEDRLVVDTGVKWTDKIGINFCQCCFSRMTALVCWLVGWKQRMDIDMWLKLGADNTFSLPTHSWQSSPGDLSCFCGFVWQCLDAQREDGLLELECRCSWCQKGILILLLLEKPSAKTIIHEWLHDKLRVDWTIMRR